jgi:predicted Zn finger-like uncharacterized protein
MRLICPSCGAQYEVDADLIPAAGRDVQCSACGHVWFESLAEPDVAAEPGVEPEIQAAPAAVVEPEEPPTLADAPPPVATVRAPRRTVTPQIAEILREEAERERAARAAEAHSMPERQEELPLTPPEPEPVPMRSVVPDVVEKQEPAPTVEVVAEDVPEPEPVPQVVPVKDDLAAVVRAAVGETTLSVPAATVRTVAAPPVVPVQEAPAPRRGRLPDIEEINSTLRPTGERAEAVTAAAADKARAGRGFRLGFSLVLLVAAVLALVYVYAPRIIAAVPAAEPVVAPYAAAVDSGRLWLDLRLQGLVDVLGTEAEG